MELNEGGHFLYGVALMSYEHTVEDCDPSGAVDYEEPRNANSPFITARTGHSRYKNICNAPGAVLRSSVDASCPFSLRR
jgi:hypothetical protein